jgi:CHAD domain-containing protein
MPKPSPVDGVDADTPVGVAARRTLASRLYDVRALEEAVALHRSEDGVHDMRVATRRLRAALMLFARQALEPERFEVKRLGGALGGVRDVHVQLTWLDGALDERAAAEVPGVRALRDERRVLLGEREDALRPVLDRWRAEVAARVEHAIGDVGGDGRLGGRPMRATLRRRLRKLEPLVDEAIASPDARTAHTLRIAVKKLRYHAELLEPALPDEVPPILTALVPMQELLGTLHDHDVHVELTTRWLPRAREAERPGGLALLGAALDARDRLAAELVAELRRVHGQEQLRALRAALK